MDIDTTDWKTSGIIEGLEFNEYGNSYKWVERVGKDCYESEVFKSILDKELVRKKFKKYLKKQKKALATWGSILPS